MGTHMRVLSAMSFPMNTKLTGFRCYSSESTQRDELSNEYQPDRVWMVFKNLCVLFALNESSLSIGRVQLTWQYSSMLSFSGRA